MHFFWDSRSKKRDFFYGGSGSTSTSVASGIWLTLLIVSFFFSFAFWTKMIDPFFLRNENDWLFMGGAAASTKHVWSVLVPGGGELVCGAPSTCVRCFRGFAAAPAWRGQKDETKEREAGGEPLLHSSRRPAHSYSSFSHTPTLHAVATKRFRFRNNERVKISCSASRQLLFF